jgi:hypothetical protein
MDEHILPAIVALDEAEAFVCIEELHLALAGADDLHRHSATRAALATTAETAAVLAARSAFAEPIAVLETIGLVGRHAALCTIIHERIETIFANTIALIASPPAPSIVTHEPEKPCLFALPNSQLLGRTAAGHQAEYPPSLTTA